MRTQATKTQPYTITAEDAASVNPLELLWGTTRLLPPVDAIPACFISGKGQAEAYHDLVNALYDGLALPEGNIIELHSGVSAVALRKCVIAHLMSLEPKHEHKIAGVAYMVHQLARLSPELKKA